jgi:hypothetical protein
MPAAARGRIRSILLRDRYEKEVALALIDSITHSWYMTATAALLNLARRGRSGPARAPHVARGAVISIHLLGSDDSAALERLAQLAESPLPTGRALVAEVDGELWAALPLSTGKMLVDPFRPSSEVQQLLALRAAQLERDAA